MTTPIKCPCTPDCQHRSCNCRALCREFQEYDRARLQGYMTSEDYDRKQALNCINSPSYRRYWKEKNRQAKKKNCAGGHKA